MVHKITNTFSNLAKDKVVDKSQNIKWLAENRKTWDIE
jgi:hypothetical protein